MIGGGTDPAVAIAFVVERAHVRSWDGTAIPLSIVRRRDLALDGSHPVWLTAYGAYGIPLTPQFIPRLKPLLDDGGVYAVAHVRGGGIAVGMVMAVRPDLFRVVFSQVGDHNPLRIEIGADGPTLAQEFEMTLEALVGGTPTTSSGPAFVLFAQKLRTLNLGIAIT